MISPLPPHARAAHAGLSGARPSKGNTDGRGPQDGQIRTLLALRGSLRSEADAGARVLRRADVLAEKELKRSGEFVLPGMVKLVVQKRKARMGRNPATGEAIKIPAKTVVKARIAKQLKDAVLPRK